MDKTPIGNMSVDELFNMSKKIADSEGMREYVRKAVTEAADYILKEALDSHNDEFIQHAMELKTYVMSKERQEDMMMKSIKKIIDKREDEIIREGE